MKMISWVLCLVMAACSTVDNSGGGGPVGGGSGGGGGGGGSGSGGGSGGGGGSGSGSGHPADSCVIDECVCPPNQSCFHACTVGGDPCHVQGAPGVDIDVRCDAGEECHVECSAGSSCEVDCNGSPECHVTCPATGCTVHNCIVGECDVACGLTALPTRTGTTATCP
jgi:hypothetical protein